MITKKMGSPVCLFIIYDSITNSIFQSQVCIPLQQYKTAHPTSAIHIISFEKDLVKTPNLQNINIQIFQRQAYIAIWSLWPAIKQLRQFLKQYTSYEIIARGPFAGYIALHAATDDCINITIQARGLIAQEYAYTHKQHMSLIHRIRRWQFERLEKKVYSTRAANVTIEAVSPALRTYLINTFDALSHKIGIAQDDIPSIMHHEERSYYRKKIRTQLGISLTTTVYCYNGSYKPWQCPQETIHFFKQQLQQEGCFLFILTPDIELFAIATQKAQLQNNRYVICSVKQHELYHYLAAADVGILFRESHLMNYVSRPTKALEYHAAGLKIIHNGTVDYLTQIPELRQSCISL